MPNILSTPPIGSYVIRNSHTGQFATSDTQYFGAYGVRTLHFASEADAQLFINCMLNDGESQPAHIDIKCVANNGRVYDLASEVGYYDNGKWVDGYSPERLEEMADVDFKEER